MQPILIEGPAVEPVSLAEMRAHLRLDGDDEDDLVTALIRAARFMVEAASRRILVESLWRLLVDRWPGGRILRLPLAPIIAIDAVRVTVSPGTIVDVDMDDVELDHASDPPCLVVGADVPETGLARAGIAIDLRAGFGATAANVPEPLRLAMKMQVARWFEHRGDVSGEQHLPAEAQALVAPFHRVRL